MKTLTRTERGWAGHFCASSHCRFRRNTLLELDKTRIVVSTVGNMVVGERGATETIGHRRYYETMVFRAKKCGDYWEADVTSGGISFESQWYIDRIDENTDNDANEMHEQVVEEFTKRMNTGERFIKVGK